MVAFEGASIYTAGKKKFELIDLLENVNQNQLINKYSCDSY